MITQGFFQSSRVWQVMFFVMPSIYLSFWLVISAIFIVGNIVMVIPSLIYFITCVFILSSFIYRYKLISLSSISTRFINNAVFKKLTLSMSIWTLISVVGFFSGIIGVAISSFIAMIASGLLFSFSYNEIFNLTVPTDMGQGMYKGSNTSFNDASYFKNNFIESNGSDVVITNNRGLNGSALSLRESDKAQDEYKNIDSVDTHQSTIHLEPINPGSGLPMIDEHTDIRGNPYGSHGID